MKACVAAVALIVTMLALAVSVSAGPKGGWGKGLLSETVEFTADGEGESGNMSYCPDAAEFQFNFHGLYFADDHYYSLICYEDDPADGVLLGSAGVCQYCEDGGVHIKDTWESWPGIEAATIILVDEESVVYLTSTTTVDLSG